MYTYIYQTKTTSCSKTVILKLPAFHTWRQAQAASGTSSLNLLAADGDKATEV
jgi:hypothetical protein